MTRTPAGPPGPAASGCLVMRITVTAARSRRRASQPDSGLAVHYPAPPIMMAELQVQVTGTVLPVAAQAARHRATGHRQAQGTPGRLPVTGPGPVPGSGWAALRDSPWHWPAAPPGFTGSSAEVVSWVAAAGSTRTSWAGAAVPQKKKPVVAWRQEMRPVTQWWIAYGW